MFTRGAAIMLALLGSPILGPALSAQAPSSSLSYDLKGLRGPVEILYDPWGVPHIYANTTDDVFFGQGFAAARDRLWQIDWDHRRALGRRAQIRGSGLVPYDRAARLFIYRGDAAAEWARYDPRVHAIAIAFSAGINAYVQLVRDQPDLLPLEFKRGGYLPDFWDADDFIRIRDITSAAATSAARRAELACEGALDSDRLTHPLEPSWTTKIPEGLDACSVKLQDMRLLQLASAPLPLGPEAKTVTLTSRDAERERQRLDPDASDGSNAWAIAPRLTHTGRAILANDPHLWIGVPSPRWISHLVAPELDVIGASFASNPGIQNGHNEHVAFGRTDFRIDDADVYVLTTRPDDQDQYLYDGVWRKFQIVSEMIEVAGAPSETVTLKYSVVGPILSEDPGAHRAIAVRLTAMEPGAASKLQYFPPDFATNWAEFTRAIRSEVFGTNYLYADTDGHIGWHAAGYAPIRPNHDGLLPVPAEGSYAWAGMLPLDLLPNELDPHRGFVASSNQMPFPPDYPYAERKIGFEWIAPDRYRRVLELLDGKSDLAQAEMVAMQHDVVLSRAKRVTRLLAELRSKHPKVGDALDLLRPWDGSIEAGSAAAALYEVWWFELSQRIRDLLIPWKARELLPYVDSRIAIDILEHPDERLGAEPGKARDDLLLTSLGRAVDDLEGKLGADWTKWSWGALHSVNLSHPVARFDADSGSALNVTGGVSGGDASTVMARWGNYPNANVSGGSSFSMVLDVGAWDNSVALNSPGQSGDPSSPHYKDLYARWLKGEVFPLLFSRDRIEASAETRVLLRPSP